MKTSYPIQYRPGEHKGQPVIWLQCPYNAELTGQIKKLPGAKWSQGQKSWYVPDTEANRKQFGPPLPTTAGALPFVSAENKEALDNFIQRLVLKAYSKSTIKTYRSEFLQLLVLLKSTLVNSLTQRRLKDYFAYCHSTLQLSENTIHSRLNAVKFYFEQVLGREKLFWEVQRPQKPIQIPAVFQRRK